MNEIIHRGEPLDYRPTAKQSMFDTDDFYTHGAEYVETEWVGCGGEFCAGPYTETFPRGEDDPPECGKCRRRERNSGGDYRPYGMEG